MASGGSSSSSGIPKAPSPPPSGSNKSKGYTGRVVAPAQSTANLRVAPVAFQFENNTLNWLTYESIYNDDKFTHTDEVRPMGVYNMPLSNLRIIAASNVVDVDSKLNSLRAVFFPSQSLSNEDLKLLLYRPWDSKSTSYDAEWTAKLPGIIKKVEDEAKAKKQTLPLARLPYNVVNNNVSAKCLGTRYHGSDNGVDHLNPNIQPEDQTWKMWQTASRSCFLRPSPPPLAPSGPTAPGSTPPHAPLPKDSSATLHGKWNYIDLKNNAVPSNAKKASDFAFDISQMNQCYSVKTGVVFVGKDNQGASKVNNLGNKATLEPDAIVATLRTEFMLAMDQYYENLGVKGHALNARKQLAILPEALTVTCLESTIMEDGAEVRVKNDGFQLRDLSRLDPKMHYFPALSTPYVEGNGNLTTWKPQQDLSVDEHKAWSSYWSINYAARIGQTKALLHLLYGFAPLTPNMQNFVFEVEPTDTRRLERTVLRDVLDFRLHTSWVRLALSAEGEQEKDLQTSLCDAKSPLSVDKGLPDRIQNLFRYEATTQAPTSSSVPMLSTSETGVFAPLVPTDIEQVQQTQSGTKIEVEKIIAAGPGEVLYADKLQYFSGLQLNFFAYSAPYRGDRISGQIPEPKEWKRSYEAILDWGLEHAMAFVDTVNQTLTESSGKAVKLKCQGQEITKKFLTDLKVNKYHKTAEKPDPLATDMFSLTDLKGQLENAKTRASLTDMHKQLCAWDFLVSGIIEDAIYKDPSVRKDLRSFLRG